MQRYFIKITTMKKTRKYSTACDILTFPHQNQEELYSELNRLGWFWNPKTQTWERDDRLPDPSSELIRVRVWADSKKVENVADLVVEGMEEKGFSLLEKSSPYQCRPPKQLESRIYLTFRIV
jgi:hypothetical protein